MLLTMILVLVRLSSLEARPAGDTKAFDQINSPNVVCQTRILAPFQNPLSGDLSRSEQDAQSVRFQTQRDEAQQIRRRLIIVASLHCGSFL